MSKITLPIIIDPNRNAGRTPIQSFPSSNEPTHTKTQSSVALPPPRKTRNIRKLKSVAVTYELEKYHLCGRVTEDRSGGTREAPNAPVTERKIGKSFPDFTDISDTDGNREGKREKERPVSIRRICHVPPHYGIMCHCATGTHSLPASSFPLRFSLFNDSAMPAATRTHTDIDTRVPIDVCGILDFGNSPAD